VERFRRKHEVVDVDGARVLFGDGWGLVRVSNTQPVLVARCEARTPEGLRRICAAVKEAQNKRTFFTDLVDNFIDKCYHYVKKVRINVKKRTIFTRVIL